MKFGNKYLTKGKRIKIKLKKEKCVKIIDQHKNKMENCLIVH